MFFFDYTLDVEAFRAETERLVKDSHLWDGQVLKIQVVDATENAMKLRVLVSASDSGKSADLNAFLRENLIAFVRDKYPRALPRTRQEPVTLSASDAAPSDAPSSNVPAPN